MCSPDGSSPVEKPKIKLIGLLRSNSSTDCAAAGLMSSAITSTHSAPNRTIRATADMASLLQAMLRESELILSNLPNCCSWSRNQSVDLVFSDIIMPDGMSGLELVRELSLTVFCVGHRCFTEATRCNTV